jgi:hypothetical protein
MEKNTDRFPVKVNKKDTSNEKIHGYLRCGEHTFGIVFLHEDLVFSIFLRLPAAVVVEWGENHPLQPVENPKDGDWYNLIVDQSYENKNDLFRLFDLSYDYVAGAAYGKKGVGTGKDERVLSAREIGAAAASAEKSAALAAEEYRDALNRYREENELDFHLNRRDIVKYLKSQENPDLEITERYDQPQLPFILRHRNKSFAWLYGTEFYVIMLVKLDADYADGLALRHPEMHRTHLMKSDGWYYLPVDCSFENRQAVYAVLEHAKILAEKEQ